MKPSAVYLRAAKRIAEINGPSCCIIQSIIDPRNTVYVGNYPIVRRYGNLFAPNKPDWKNNAVWLSGSGLTDDERHGWRVLALLFMHHIAKDSE